MTPTLLAALFAGFLILLMQAGFGLLATGLGRAKNSAHTMSMHLLLAALVTLGLFICGFALLGDGPDSAAAGHWRFHHSRGYFLQADRANPRSLAWFVLAAGYAAAAAAIPTGALIERWTFKSFFAFASVLGAVIFPVYACWLWTGGWLAQLGTKVGLAHGAIDYAGSSVVHLQGGTLAFIMTWMLGPRLGKYDENGRPRPILGHNVPMVILGTFVLCFGWLGLTTGRAFVTDQSSRAGLIAVNTILSAAGGGLTAALYMWLRFGRPDPSLTCNGLLAGLVAICAGCAFVSPWAALLIGAIGGLLAEWSVLLCESRGLDDPVGATSMHGLAGLWGMLAVGLLADGTFGNLHNDVAGSVRGLFYGGGGRQLLCQLIAIAACIAWAAITGGILFALTGRFLGHNRVPPEVEFSGLDIPEMGAPGYPEFIARIAPDSTGLPPGLPHQM